mmetsp:Transcript_10468/g.15981  ORF Transcript_10468/g.15981 Transcript_10468/m.15981 type:complete len:372 (+) Transcript_10468:1023-2138(+)
MLWLNYCLVFFFIEISSKWSLYDREARIQKTFVHYHFKDWNNNATTTETTIVRINSKALGGLVERAMWAKLTIGIHLQRGDPQRAAEIFLSYILVSTPSSSSLLSCDQEEEEEEEKNKSVMELSSSSSSSSLTTTILSTTLASSALLLFMPHDAAFAAGPDWGLFEGKTGSLLHPVSMASLFFYTLYTGYLGLQWRRQRTMTTEINALKKQIPKFKESTIDEAIAAAAKESTDGSGSSSLVAQLTAAKPIQAQVASMEAERKELIAKGPRDQHFKSGSLLAFLGTFFAIEGPLNTYARAGKLFPGPHLYAGAACVVLWSAAFATVPSMQKGNDTARSIHIASNTIGLGLFGWQVVSGIPILLKVIEKTKWP